jgi:hypothetical protein
MTIIGLITGIKTTLNALVTTGDITGVWFGTAPDLATDPYITLTIPDAPEGQSMGASPARWHDVIVTITIWDNEKSPLGVMTIADKVKTAFHSTPPLGGSYSACISATQTSYIVMEDGDGGYFVQMDYLFTIEEA